MAALQVGDMAPDFALPSTRGEVRLSGWLQRGPVLLVFYPGDDTAVCTVPLADQGRIVGAITLERDDDTPFESLDVSRFALRAEAAHHRNLDTVFRTCTARAGRGAIRSRWHRDVRARR